MQFRNKSDLNGIKKILIIQFRPFGDVLLATSYLKALQERFPDARIDFLVKKPYHEVLAQHPYLSHVMSFEQTRGLNYVISRIKIFAMIRRRQYDLVIDQQHGTGSAQVVFTSGARYKLGWSHGIKAWLYNLKAVRGPARYNAIRNFDMLVPLGITDQNPDFYVHIDPKSEDFVVSWLREQQVDPTELILMSPGSPRAKKKWHPMHFAKLTDLILSQTKMKVVLLQGPNEFEDCCQVISGSRYKPLLGPKTTLNQVAALLKQCRMLVCNDGGLNHLSVALEVPSLAIFGNTPPKIWSPQGYIPHHHHLHNPDWKRHSDNGFGISSDEAFQKILEIMTDLNITPYRS